MDITQLKMFQTVVECGTMAKASLQLHCVPSNITTRIKQLEEELGAPLFYREGKALKLTPSGEIFLDYCHKILALCDEAKRSIHPDAPPSGPLKLEQLNLLPQLACPTYLQNIINVIQKFLFKLLLAHGNSY